MPRIFFKKKLLGTSAIPQSETHSEEEKRGAVKITLVVYNQEHFEDIQVTNFEECIPYLNSEDLIWINIDGHPSHSFLMKMQDHFKLHPLLIEDISTEQRPKVEPYDDVLYMVLRSLYYDPERVMIENEQISLILGPNYMISFQEREHHISTYIKERIRSRKNRIHNLGPDYLMYTLIDVVVDNYFIVLEKVAETVDDLEEELVNTTDALILRDIHLLKRETIIMRKSIWPLREVISKLHRGDFEHVSPNISLYLRDLYDHTIQVVDTIETFRDMISGILDLYLSNIGHKTNEIMKLLAIAATIFAPLTFLTGIWGMNFKEMPELNWAWGYPVALGLMFIMITIMVLFFKKKKWI
jgi:magnesium transporter